MNAIRAVLIFAIVFTVVNAKKLSEDEKKAAKGFIADCQKKTGATDEEVDKILDNNSMDSQKAKCLGSCMMEQFGMISRKSDGKYALEPENIVNMAKMQTADEKNIQQVREVAETCKVVSNPDDCEFSMDLIKCVKAEAEKRGINPNDF